jgi:folate-binding protein YgfZ
MGPIEAPQDELAGLLGEGAFARPPLRVIRVTGADATSWLHDLVTADIDSLAPGRARRSLLLTPTGRIRADVTVVRDGSGLLVLQGSAQPDRIEALLDPYVLSSDVALGDVTDETVVFSWPAGAPAIGGTTFTPAAAGPGTGALVTRDGADVVAATLVAGGLMEAGPEALEAWRILRGIPRMGADVDTDSLPAEAGLEGAIDRTKGCFLGQESVARVANLGHPPRILRHLGADGDVGPGDPVSAGGAEVGHITSAARDLTGVVVALARVRWDARDAELEGPNAVRLMSLPPPN